MGSTLNCAEIQGGPAKDEEIQRGESRHKHTTVTIVMAVSEWPLALRDIADPGAVTGIVKSKAYGILHDEAVQLFVAIDPVVAAIVLLPQPSRYFSPVIWRHRW